MEMTTISKYYIVVVVDFSISVEAQELSTCYRNFWLQVFCSTGTFYPSLAAFIPNLGVGKPHPVGSTLTFVGSLNLKTLKYLQLYQGSSGVPDFRYLAKRWTLKRRDPTSLLHRWQTHCEPWWNNKCSML